MSKRLLPLLLAIASLPLFAQSADPEFVRDAVGVRHTAAAPRIAESAKLAPALRFEAAEVAVPEELDAIREWNRAGKRPARNGFSRPVADAVSVRLVPPAAAKDGAVFYARGVMAASSRGVVWGGAIEVDGAYRVRLRLSDVKLPQGAVLWVYSASDAPIAFGRELLDDDGGIWTPSVAGETVFLEIEAPMPKNEAEAAAFRITSVMEIVDEAASEASLTPKAQDSPSCLIDLNCAGSLTPNGIENYSKGIAHLQYAKDGKNYVCSGGLLNDKDTTSVVPYLLTANHCFSTSGSAASLEAFFDYKYFNCETTGRPSLSSLPRSSGATLLATSAATDFTLVRLNSTPSGRWFLGWNADPSAVGNGTKIYRLSHPVAPEYDTSISGALPQMFSSGFVNKNFGSCDGLPQSNFIYATDGDGGTYGGSSGSPVFLANGQVVGQLYGSCGPDPNAGCDGRNAKVDGAFSITYNSVKQYIDNSGAQPPPAQCVPSSTRACLGVGDRFGVSVRYTAHDGRSGDATAIKYTENSVLFWFFSNSNIEMIVKVLDGCGVNNRWWVYGAATTDVAYTITVTDSRPSNPNFAQRTYTNALGNKAPAITDAGAFVCP